MTMFKVARETAGLTQEAAAPLVGCGSRSLSDYEAEDQERVKVPPPGVVLLMGQHYNDPSLTIRYCREYCPIGQTYSYIHLDAIDDSLAAICLKLIEEMREVQEVAMTRLLTAVINKQIIADFTDQEIEAVEEATHELLDVEHLVEITKIRLAKMGFDVPSMVARHNRKCDDHGYTQKRKTA